MNTLENNYMEKKKFIPPDYSECKDEVEDDDEDLDLDDDDEEDDVEDEDPAEEEKNLEVSRSETIPQSTPPPTNTYQPFNLPNNQSKMPTPTWPGTPSGNPWTSQNQQNQNPWGGSSMPWGSQQKPANPWGSPSTTPGWGQGNQVGQKEILDRKKKVIICDVLDCLVCTLDGAQKLGLIPRGVWDIQNRLDVWFSLKRFTNIERIYAMIPRSLILNSSGSDSWAAFLNYEACALGEFLRIPTSSIQILTQSHISQSKYEMVSAILDRVNKEDIVYIGTQSGHPGQNTSDIDTATSLGIDYIDLHHFLVAYN